MPLGRLGGCQDASRVVKESEIVPTENISGDDGTRRRRRTGGKFTFTKNGCTVGAKKRSYHSVAVELFSLYEN